MHHLGNFALMASLVFAAYAVLRSSNEPLYETDVAEWKRVLRIAVDVLKTTMPHLFVQAARTPIATNY